ncbi:MAG: DnaD domain protein [Bacilli bacterium]|nr:DnaD domain protein [Bacilli bacterium]
MKNQKMLDILKTKNIVIPLYIYKCYPKLNMGLDEFMFLMYLYNQGEMIIFNPNIISNDLGTDIKKIMLLINNLTDAKLINLEVVKNEKNITEEYISLSFFYEKLNLLILDEINNDDETDESIFSIIEREFGRTLSPIEYEIVKAWLDSGISIDLIKEALKEATFNGVSNLRYIDKILYEWGKKGIKTPHDVDKNRVEYKEKKNEKLEVFEYNWLEDDEY